MKFSIDGLADVQKALKQLDKSITDPAVWQASKAALKPVAEDAKNRVALHSSDDGDLEDSIKVKKLKKRQQRYYGYKAAAIVGADYGIAPHAHLVEYGTVKRHYVKKNESGKRTVVFTGVMPAKPFLRPALQKNRSKVSDLFLKSFKPKLKRQLRKIKQ